MISEPQATPPTTTSVASQFLMLAASQSQLELATQAAEAPEMNKTKRLKKPKTKR